MSSSPEHTLFPKAVHMLKEENSFSDKLQSRLDHATASERDFFRSLLFHCFLDLSNLV